METAVSSAARSATSCAWSGLKGRDVLGPAAADKAASTPTEPPKLLCRADRGPSCRAGPKYCCTLMTSVRRAL